MNNWFESFECFMEIVKLLIILIIVVICVMEKSLGNVIEHFVYCFMTLNCVKFGAKWYYFD